MKARSERFIDLIEQSSLKSQNLTRTPEPSMEMDTEGSTLDFNKSIETNIASNYAAVLSLIDRVLPSSQRHQAVDLCSGPGHFSIYLNQFLGLKKISGIEISPKMNELAQANVTLANLNENVSFIAGDARVACPDLIGKADLVTFANSAHHMDDIVDVRKILENAESFLNTEGVLVLSDLGRLKDIALTRDFVELAGSEFVDRNMPALYEDFYNSLLAAWLPEELALAIPEKSQRRWFQFVLPGLRNLQALVAVPRSRTNPFVQECSVDPQQILKSEESRIDYEFLKSLGNPDFREVF